MIERFKTLFRKQPRDGTADTSRDEQELRVAAAALMVEAAQLDDDFDDAERAAILALVARRFDLEQAQSTALLAAAEAQAEDAHGLHRFTRIIKATLSAEERVELLEMLWEVVYTDGELHDYEANLMRRLAGLLQVPDRASGAARKRALNRLGLPKA